MGQDQGLYEEFTFPDDEVTVEPIEVAETEEVDEANEVEPGEEPELEVVDTTPEYDRNRQPMPQPIVDDLENDDLSQYDAKVRERIKQYRKVWHDKRREQEAAARERDEAIRAAQALVEENRRLKGALSGGEKQLIDTATREGQLELDQAKALYRAAYDAGDTEKVLDAQERISQAQIKLDKLRNYRPEYSQPESAPPTAPQQRPVQPPPLDRETEAWQKRNPWFGSSQHEDMTSLALGLHQSFVRQGYAPGSEVYFKQIDAAMRKRFPEYFGEAVSKQASKPRRQPGASVVAPASRSTAPRKITLTREQVKLANSLGITPEQYARELIKLEKSND